MSHVNVYRIKCEILRQTIKGKIRTAIDAPRTQNIGDSFRTNLGTGRNSISKSERSFRLIASDPELVNFPPSPSTSFPYRVLSPPALDPFTYLEDKTLRTGFAKAGSDFRR